MLKINANYSFYSMERKYIPSHIKAQTPRVLYRSVTLSSGAKPGEPSCTSHVMDVVAKVLHTAIGEDISLEAGWSMPLFFFN